MNSQNKDKFICGKFDPPIHWHEQIKITGTCSCGLEFMTYDDFKNHIKKSNPNFESKTGRVELFKLFEKSGLYEEMINPDVPQGWFPLVWITNDDGLFRDEIYKALGGEENEYKRTGRSRKKA